MNFDVMAIIPARAGSKRLPNKNNKLIGNHPLWLNAVRIARAAGIKDIVVSTDDEEILDQRGQLLSAYEISDDEETLDAIRILRRSEEASTDEATIDDVIRDLRKQEKLKPILCVIQPTSPLLLPSTLRHALEIFVEREDVNCLVAVNQLYKPCGAFYIFWKDLFSEFDTIWMPRLGICMLKDFQALDIDYIWDWRIAESIFAGQRFVQEVTYH